MKKQKKNKEIVFPDVPPPILPEDERSLAESLGMAKGVDLSSREQINQLNRLIRQDNMDGHLHIVLTVAVYAIGFILIICVCCVIAGYALPDKYNPFDKDSLDRLKEFLLTGGFGAIIGEAGRRVFGKDLRSE